MRLMLALVMLNSAAVAQAPPLTWLNDFTDIRASISPDGKTIACIIGSVDGKTNRGVSSLWFIGTDTGEKRPVTLDTDSVQQALWSPKGDKVLVQATPRGGGESWLWIVDPVTGEGRKLVPVDRGNHYIAHQGASLCWSPDGASVAYLAAEKPRPKKTDEPLVIDRIQYKTRTSFSDNRASQLWTVDVASGKTKQLTSGPRDVHSIDWSPKGDEIVMCMSREADPDANWNNDLTLVNVSGGTLTPLTKTAGNEMTPVWRPDGVSIAYTMTKRPLTTIDSVAEDAHVWVVDRASGESRELAPKLDRRCSQIRWDPDGKNVYCVVADHGNRVIRRLPADASEAKAVFPLEGPVAEYSIAKVGRRGCCVMSTSVKPAELYRIDLDTGDATALTKLNTAKTSEMPLVRPVRLECKSFDGVPIEAWLMVPPGASKEKKAPLILNIHGGPHGMHTSGFSPMQQLLCSRGYAVLSPNPRGSAGYGQKFSDGCVNDWGGGDYKDLMASLDDALAKHPELDGSRLGVTGGSYGGYMTNWIITQNDRFKAAVSYAGLSNLISFYSTSLYQDLIHVEFGGMPWDNYEILWERSPIKHIKKAKTPTMIQHGEADFDVHISQSEELYTCLKRRGVETVFVRYPRQGHGASEPRQKVDLLERTIGWFDRYLK